MQLTLGKTYWGCWYLLFTQLIHLPKLWEQLEFLMTKILGNDSHSLILLRKDFPPTSPPIILIREDDHHNATPVWQNDDSTRNLWIKLCLFVWLLCFFSVLFSFLCFKLYCILSIIFFLLSPCILFMLYCFLYITHVIVYWIWINALCITCFNFWKYTQTSRLGGGLTICPMTTSQSLDAWNPQLISEW
jgi:hypothetical protein